MPEERSSTVADSTRSKYFPELAIKRGQRSKQTHHVCSLSGGDENTGCIVVSRTTLPRVVNCLKHTFSLTLFRCASY